MRLMYYALSFNAVQNNTSLKLPLPPTKMYRSFNAVQNNTSLKPLFIMHWITIRFNAVQNNTSLKPKRHTL